VWFEAMNEMRCLFLILSCFGCFKRGGHDGHYDGDDASDVDY